MEKAIVFGAGSRTKLNIDKLKEQFNIVSIVDNDSTLWGKELEGISINSPSRLKQDDYDLIVLSNMVASTTEAWINQIKELGVEKQINYDYCVYNVDARVEFLKNFAGMVYANSWEGNVAEAGVFRGEFAREINKYFCDRQLYLFDTFEGFNAADLDSEDVNESLGRYSDTSVQFVMNKMVNKERVVIKKGLFPDTAVDIDDQFIFVNLDMDLEKPTRAGLELFKGKMSSNGVILVHDYFNPHYPGIKRCVDEWLDANTLYRGVPIGDNMSILIIGL